MDLQKLALADPVAALGIFLRIDRVPFSVNMMGSFSTLSADRGQPVQTSIDAGAIAQRTWIDNISYSLQVPNLFPNCVWKTQYDAELKKSPGITVQLLVQGGPDFLISPDYAPLENVVNLIRSDRWPAGWPLFKLQTIQGMFQLAQPPGGLPSNMGPYNFTLTFNGWQFLDMWADEIDPNVAAETLYREGILLQDPKLIKELGC